MNNRQIPLSADIDCDHVAQAIDDAISAAALRISLRATLKQFPGSIHWHTKNGRESGTLEITLWPKERRAWFTIQSGRSAAWIDSKLKSMLKHIKQKLKS